MSKNEPTKDNFYSKVFVATIVVIWVSLVGGNWLGHYAVERGLLGKSQKSEYKPMTNQKPKPWVTVDPKQVEVVEQLTGQKNAVPATTSTPTPDASATPEASRTPEEIITSTPVPQDSPHPVTPSPRATPTPRTTPVDRTPSEGTIVPTPVLGTPIGNEPPQPTPALDDQKYQLQFGSFSTQDNAQRMADELSRVGQPAKVEEIDTGKGKVYRVRGGVYTEEEARLQRDKLREQNIDAYIVNKS